MCPNVSNGAETATLPVQLKSSQASMGLNRLAAKQLRQSRICTAKQTVRSNLASTVFTHCPNLSKMLQPFLSHSRCFMIFLESPAEQT